MDLKNKYDGSDFANKNAYQWEFGASSYPSRPLWWLNTLAKQVLSTSLQRIFLLGLVFFFFGKLKTFSKKKEKKSKMLIFLLWTLVSSQPHVLHQVKITNTAAHCQLAHVYENASLFLDAQNHSTDAFVCNPDYAFGLYLLPNASFNMIYSVACRKWNCTQYPNPCARVVFLISAMGPAWPVVKIIEYSGGMGDVTLDENTIMLYVNV